MYKNIPGDTKFNHIISHLKKNTIFQTHPRKDFDFRKLEILPRFDSGAMLHIVIFSIGLVNSVEHFFVACNESPLTGKFYLEFV